jgi:hypothetical protein
MCKRAALTLPKIDRRAVASKCFFFYDLLYVSPPLISESVPSSDTAVIAFVRRVPLLNLVENTVVDCNPTLFGRSEIVPLGDY